MQERRPSTMSEGSTEPHPTREVRPEARRSRRVPVEVVVTLVSESTFYTGFTCDISQGGVFVATHALLPRGAEVELLLWLGGVRFVIPGRVRWMRDLYEYSPEHPPGIGVEFLRLPPEAERVIKRFLGAREALLYED